MKGVPTPKDANVMCPLKERVIPIYRRFIISDESMRIELEDCGVR